MPPRLEKSVSVMARKDRTGRTGRYKRQRVRVLGYRPGATRSRPVLRTDREEGTEMRHDAEPYTRIHAR